MQTVCPTCDGDITIPLGTEVSEIIACPECQTRLVVDSLGDNPQVVVAPAVEEDWGQ